jgi:hypothetical protein
MNRLATFLVAILGLSLVSATVAQEPTQPSDTPGAPEPIEAHKEVVVHWSLGEQAWDFNDILTAYEPEKGTFYPRTGTALAHAVWRLKLIKDLQPGETARHNEIEKSPFKIVLLDENRTVINPDVPAKITPVTGHKDDTIDMVVPMPDEPLLKDVRYVRVQRRTEIGF